MEENYFKCDPEKFQCKADCCKSDSTLPVLTFGDYYRLSKFTGESVVELWNQKGHVALGFNTETKNKRFTMALSLFHNPCPYLSPENECSVYPARSLGCVEFPFTALVCGHTKISGYPATECMKNVSLDDKQMEIFRGIDRIAVSECGLDLRFFWKGPVKIIDLNDKLAWERKVSDAEKVIAKGSVYDSMRKEVESSLSRLAELVEEFGFEEVPVEKFARLNEPIIYVLWKDKLAKNFQNTFKHRREYDKTTAKLASIVSNS